MDKILGKNFVIIIILLSFLSMHGGIRLEMRTDESLGKNKALVGQPFIVEAIIDGVHGSVEAPHIEGFDTMNAKRTGMYMSSINGASTTKYTYHVRIDKPGSYSIGPARLMHQQQELISNTLSVIVENNTSSTTKHAHTKNKKSDTKAFLRLMIDSDHVVVGQQMIATLRFYYQDPTISLVNIVIPEIPSFDIKSADKPVGGSENMHGVAYKYAEWQWCMYPQKSGEFVIPACSIDYELPTKDSRMFGGFFMFMNARPERKRVYSNAIKIIVDPLPYYDGKVDAIGVYDSINAQILPPVTKEGEGMSFTLEIIGKGNIDAIKTPELNLPEALKYYDSHTTITKIDDRDEWYKKRFEFVVQGMKVGDWHIPEQEFVFFDINHHEYKTLKTCPLSVSIQPSNYSSPIVMQTNDEDKKRGENQLDIIAPLNKTGPWYPVSERYSLSWFIFCCIFCVPVLCVGYPIIGNQLTRLHRVRRWSKKKMCKNFRKKIMTQLDHKDLYKDFMELFSVLIETPVTALSSDIIENYLSNNGFSENDIMLWRSFFAETARAAYTKTHEQTNELCGVAILWLDQLEKAV